MTLNVLTLSSEYSELPDCNRLSIYEDGPELNKDFNRAINDSDVPQCLNDDGKY